MAEVRWTAEAERWLSDIYEYIAADNPAAAARTVEGIYDRVQDLAKFPELGHRYLASARPVRIAYLVREDKGIDILGVFHGALDITRYQL